jgi:DNA-directed RNA polymerase specialized sigma subunit
MKEQTKDKDRIQKITEIIKRYFWQYNNEQKITLERLKVLKSPSNQPLTLQERNLIAAERTTYRFESCWNKLSVVEQDILRAIYDTPNLYVGTITKVAARFGTSERQVQRIRKGAFDKLKKWLF